MAASIPLLHQAPQYDNGCLFCQNHMTTIVSCSQYYWTTVVCCRAMENGSKDNKNKDGDALLQGLREVAHRNIILFFSHMKLWLCYIVYMVRVWMFSVPTRTEFFWGIFYSTCASS